MARVVGAVRKQGYQRAAEVPSMASIRNASTGTRKETPNSDASARADGSFSPGFQTPSSMHLRIPSATWCGSLTQLFLSMANGSIRNPQLGNALMPHIRSEARDYVLRGANGVAAAVEDADELGRDGRDGAGARRPEAEEQYVARVVLLLDVRRVRH